MSNQKMGGCKKRKRARIAREHITERIKETQVRRHNARGCGYRKRQSSRLVWPKDATPMEVKEGIWKRQTFEDDYKTYRKTRGKRGLNPNPKFRQDENPVYLKRNSVFNTGRYHLQDLMENAIKYSKVI